VLRFKEDFPDEDKLPDLGPLRFYADCFNELATCRVMGGPIPFTSIVEFARIYEIDDIAHFNDIIRYIDDAYLKAVERKNEAEKPKG
jgi:hypothetical protein